MDVYQNECLKKNIPILPTGLKVGGGLKSDRRSNSRSIVRVLDQGGMIWESDEPFKSLDELLDDLEEKIAQKREVLGV
jgi:hypothetical protein